MMWRDPSETTTGTAEKKMRVVIGRLARRRRRRATWQVHIRSSHGVICTVAWVRARSINHPNDQNKKKRETWHLPLPKSTRALFNEAEMGDDDDKDGPAIAPTTSSSDPSSDCAKTFVAFLAVDLALAFVTATLALCRLPAFCAGVDRTAVISVLVRPTRDLARRRLRRTAGPDDVPDSGVASSSIADIVVAASVVIGWSVICKLAQRRRGRLLRGACFCGLCVGTSTASMKTPLRLRLWVCLCCVRVGVGDGLRSYDCGRGINARGTVLNAVREVTQCCCCAAGLGVTGRKRHCWTSSRSASLSSSSSVAMPLSRSLFGFPASCAARFFFAGRESKGVLLARRLPGLKAPPPPGEAMAMRSSTEVRTGGFGGEFSLSGPSEVFFGDRIRGVRGCRDGVVGDAGATTKSSAVGTRGEKIISVRLTVAVFDGRWGEDTAGVAFGVEGISTSSSFAWVMKGLESCDVSVASDAPSSSTAMVDEEPHVNAGSSVGTRLFSARATSQISAGIGVGLAVTFLPHAWRQVTTDDGHPPFGTVISA